MRKNSDYSLNNQLLQSKFSVLENVFRKKCDFCPFLGDFSHFAKAFRHPVGTKKRKNGKVKTENYFSRLNFEPSAEMSPFSVSWRTASMMLCSLPFILATSSLMLIGSVARSDKICCS